MSEPMAMAELIGTLIILFPLFVILFLIVPMMVYTEIRYRRLMRKWRRWLDEKESDEQN